MPDITYRYSRSTRHTSGPLTTVADADLVGVELPQLSRGRRAVVLGRAQHWLFKRVLAVLAPVATGVRGHRRVDPAGLSLVDLRAITGRTGLHVDVAHRTLTTVWSRLCKWRAAQMPGMVGKSQSRQSHHVSGVDASVPESLTSGGLSVLMESILTRRTATRSTRASCTHFLSANDDVREPYLHLTTPGHLIVALMQGLLCN